MRRTTSGTILPPVFQFQLIQTIRRTPEDVLALLTSFGEIPKYVPAVSAAEQTSPGPVRVGTTFVQHGRFLGWRMAASTTVTVHEPPHRFGYSAVGPLPYEAVYTLTPVPGGSRLRAEVTVRPHWPLALLEPLLTWNVPGFYRKNLDRMRQVLEGQGSPAAALSDEPPDGPPLPADEVTSMARAANRVWDRRVL